MSGVVFSGADADFIMMCIEDVGLLEKISATLARGEDYHLTADEVRRLSETLDAVLSEGK